MALRKRTASPVPGSRSRVTSSVGGALQATGGGAGLVSAAQPKRPAKPKSPKMTASFARIDFTDSPWGWNGRSSAEGHALAPRIGAAFEPAGDAPDGLEAARHLDGAHVVAHRPKSWGERFEFRAGLDLRRPVPAAEVGELDRGLRVEAAVEDREERLRDVLDDEASAGAADGEREAALPVEHQERRHRAARPLAGRDAVGHRQARVRGPELEVGELVVEQEAAHHDAAPVGPFDGR